MREKLRSHNGAQLVIGLLFGIVFGFLLDRGGATDYEVIRTQLLLQDFAVLKIIFTAIIVAGPGLYLMAKRGLISLHLKPTRPVANLVGGLIFGVGFALLGYCPGTAPGAVGTGSVHAVFGIVGMLLGAALYAALYPRLRTLLHKGERPQLTLHELLHTNPWVLFGAIGAIFITIFILLARLGL